MAVNLSKKIWLILRRKAKAPPKTDPKIAHNSWRKVRVEFWAKLEVFGDYILKILRGRYDF